MKLGRWILAAMVVAAVAAGIGFLIRRQPATDEAVFVRSANEPNAMVAMDDGGLLYGERRTGEIRKVDADGRGQPSNMRVTVSSQGERGLLGLALGRDGKVFASWTDRDDFLMVGEVGPPVRIVWKGPKTPTTQIGGKIAFAPDGKLLVGIGDLGDPDKVDAPAEPNGKIYQLDPGGGESQQPQPLASGWHRPAFAVTPGNQLWVADNRAGSQRDRLAQVSKEGQPAFSTQLPPRFDPTGIVAPKVNQLFVCGSGTGQLVRYTIQPQGFAAPDEGDVAKDCALGLAILKDGRLVYATRTQIRVA